MKTKQLNVRLSTAAWDNLAAICQASGLNHTAAVEVALSLLKAILKGNDFGNVIINKFLSDHYNNPPARGLS